MNPALNTIEYCSKRMRQLDASYANEFTFWVQRWPQQEIPENYGEELGEERVYNAKNYKRFFSFLLISYNYHFVCRY